MPAKPRGLWWVVSASVLLQVLPLSAAESASKPATPPDLTRPLQVVMFTGGIAHEYERLPKQLAQSLARDGDLKVEVTTDLGKLNEAVLDQYDVLMFNGCLDNVLSDQQRSAIMAMLRKGKGLVGIHCAVWCFQNWPEFREFMGAMVLGHDPLGDYGVVSVDRGHPIMQGVPERMTVKDEPYVMTWWGDNNHVLMQTAAPHGEMKKIQPVAWTTRALGARVFTVVLGHDEAVQADASFQKLLGNGIRWAGKRLGPATMLSEAERAEGFVPLFNGKNLDGWRYAPKLWKVQDGIIIGDTRPDGLKTNSCAISELAYDDFILRYSVKLVDGNSGVQFRSIEWPDFQVAGYQQDVVPGGWGNLHEQEGRRRLVDGWTGKAEQVVQLQDWNDMEIVAKGKHIVLKTNGLVTADWMEGDDTKPAVGIIGLQLHREIMMQVQFTNIRIKPLTKSAVTRPATSTAGE